MTSPLDSASSQTMPAGGASIPLAVQAAPTSLASATTSKKGDFTFHDLLETINPLQHIPLISTAYRAITGDSISPAARIAGDSLYGGIFGLAGAVVDSLVEGETGKDIGSHIVATVFGDDADASTGSADAANASADTADASAGAPTSLLPPSANTAAAASASAPTSALSAATAAATAAANAPVRPAPPTDFYLAQQKVPHSGRGVPLTTSVPVGDDHKDAKAALEKKINDTLAKAAKDANNPATPPAAATSTPPAVPGLPSAAPSPTSLLPTGAPTASGIPAPAPSANVASLMLQALDKYKTLDQQRASNTPTPPPVLIN